MLFSQVTIKCGDFGPGRGEAIEGRCVLGRTVSIGK